MGHLFEFSVTICKSLLNQVTRNLYCSFWQEDHHPLSNQTIRATTANWPTQPGTRQQPRSKRAATTVIYHVRIGLGNLHSLARLLCLLTDSERAWLIKFICVYLSSWLLSPDNSIHAGQEDRGMSERLDGQ